MKRKSLSTVVFEGLLDQIRSGKPAPAQRCRPRPTFVSNSRSVGPWCARRWRGCARKVWWCHGRAKGFLYRKRLWAVFPFPIRI